MEWNEKDFQSMIIDYVDQVKDFMSPEIWQNVLLDCSKNELFVLWFLFRQSESNMTQIAEYINVPLNTATGIISRMEKRELVLRQHSKEDKRVVTISLAPKGNQQLQMIMREFTFYGKKIFASLTQEESKMVFRIMDKVMTALKEKRVDEVETKKVRKITIE